MQPHFQSRTLPAELLGVSFRNQPAALAAAQSDLRQRLEELGVDDLARYAVDLTLEELVGNTLRYGYAEGVGGQIRVELSVSDTTLTLTIRDDARPFDPTQHEPEPPGRTLSETSIGGRGIAMVRQMTRDMRYERRGGRNRLEVTIARAIHAV